MNYKSNSHKSKEEASTKKKYQSVVDSPAKIKKRTELQKATSSFFEEDAKSVAMYVFSDVLVPSAKKLLYDMVTKALGMFLYSGKEVGGAPKGRRAYHEYFKEEPTVSKVIRRNGGGLEYDPVICESYSDADGVLSAMRACADKYGVVSIKAMYEFAGIYDDNYMLDKFGWTLDSMRYAKIVTVENGYLIKTPRAMAFD